MSFDRIFHRTGENLAVRNIDPAIAIDKIASLDAQLKVIILAN
jgi:hypothetical protein